MPFYALASQAAIINCCKLSSGLLKQISENPRSAFFAENASSLWPRAEKSERERMKVQAQVNFVVGKNVH